MRITLEVESYLVKTPTVGQVEMETEPISQDHLPMATVKQTTELEQLTQRLERLEETTQRRDTAVQSQRYGEQAAGEPRKSLPADRRPGTVICRRCGKEGHYARGCTSRRPQRQGN